MDAPTLSPREEGSGPGPKSSVGIAKGRSQNRYRLKLNYFVRKLPPDCRIRIDERCRETMVRDGEAAGGQISAVGAFVESS